ncbi:MAG: Ig-like domain-containing protein [Bacteroidota bacterium]
MRKKKLLSILAILPIAFGISCKKDKFIENVGLCPLVLITSPVNGAVNVPLNKIVTVTFNEKMNPTTITTASFTLVNGTNIAGALSYDAETATMSFKPTLALKPNTTYTGKVTTAVKDLTGNALQANYIWSFSTGAIIAPIVIETDPTANATNVVLNKVISATFNMPMDAATINTTSVIVKQGTTAITGAVAYANNMLTFSPSVALVSNTSYTVTITTAAKSSTAIAMADNYVWGFTTGSTLAPTVILTDPANNDIDVPLNKIITADFSEAMDATTITSATFTITDGVTPIAGTVTYSGVRATFTPSSNLLSNKTYTGTITIGAKNPAGVALAGNFIWTFKTVTVVPPTVILTDPFNNETNVNLNKIITATFSEAMDATTITSLTFIIKEGTNAVSGVVTYAGTVATFTPSVNLLSGTTYVATITTAAKNLAGTSLTNNYVWTFSTDAPLGPDPIVLNTADSYGIFAAAGITNVGASIITNLNVGISPGFRSSITGFFVVDGGPGVINNGQFFAADDAAPTPANLILSKSHLQAAYDAAEGATTPAPAAILGDLGGQTLAPGIYKTASDILIQSGNLTLDAQGDVNAVWIFQAGTALNTIGGAPFPSAAGGNVILTGGANADNVFWQVGSSATIGDYTSFKGNIMALTSITMNSGSELVGRTLVLNGAVSLSGTNKITKP